MTDEPATPTRYLLELAAPDAGWHDIERLTQRARTATAEPQRGVRFIRAIYVPEDGSCFLLYEAATAGAAAEAAAAAELVVRRASEVLHADTAHADGGPR